MTERRKHSRRRTLLSGRLEIAKLAGWELDCTVRNLSETGARLTIPGKALVPQNLSLAVSEGPRRQAKLIWYREGQAGFELSERRATPRPVPANDVGVARPAAAAAGLSARIAAIAAKERTAKPPVARSHFTGI